LDGNSSGFTATLSMLDEITFETLEEIFLQIQQSNQLVLITDIEWAFIISPPSIVVGGSPRVKPPYWAPAVKFRNTWLGWNVNCAAYALNYLMFSTEKRYNEGINRSVADAKELQDLLGWGDFISIRQIQDFVDLYDQYRVSIVHPTTLITPHEFIFTGKNFVFTMDNGNRCPSKVLYLIYDAQQKH
jgi:hypothetical protein